VLTAVACVSVVAVVGGVVVVSDPAIAEHLLRYLEQDNAVTISGRIPLWQEASPYIGERWLFGHGYLSSRFFFLNTLSDHLTFLWSVSPPTSLHSAYLDIERRADLCASVAGPP
jgi:O-antigen ligase